jgi:hypothetical protein
VLILVLVAFVGVLVCAVVVLFVVIAMAVKVANQEVSALENAIAAGYVSELAEWNPSLFSWLSKDAIGSSYYFRPMGGARTSKVAATVPACQGPATLLAFSAERTARRGQGKINVLVSGLRVDLVLQGGLWLVAANGQPLGLVDPSSGRIEDATRTPIGAYLRSSAAAELNLRGVSIAVIDSGAKLHRKRAAILRPLFRQVAPALNDDAPLWLLALVGLELGAALMPGGGAPLTGVS